MRILVTGATGYVGAHFVKVAAEAGHTIVATDYNLEQNDLKKYCAKIVEWDIRKPISNKIVGVDKVVHIAARTKVPNSVKDPYDYYLTNVVGTKNVIDAAPCNHFVYCSTGSAFNPASNPYAGSKHAGELVAKQFNDKWPDQAPLQCSQWYKQTYPVFLTLRENLPPVHFLLEICVATLT